MKRIRQDAQHSGEKMKAAQTIRVLFLSGLLTVSSGHVTLATGFERVNSLLSGGFTFQAPNQFTPTMMARLKELPTRRVRLINVDRNVLLGIAPDGSPVIDWSKSTPAKLPDSLAAAQANGWIPRIVWGLNPPNALMNLAGVPAGRKYGPSNWDQYRKYTRAMLDMVHMTYGFDEFEVEVGNEFDATYATPYAWFVKDTTQVPADIRDIWQQNLPEFLNLYESIADTVDAYRQEHNDVTIRVGGPAATGGSFYPWLMSRPTYFNYVLNFLEGVVERGVTLDFLSWHYYGGGRDGGFYFMQGITRMKEEISLSGLNAEVSISEWGFRSASDGANRQPMAGAFALDLIHHAERAELNDAIFLTASPSDYTKNYPSLFYRYFDAENRLQYGSSYTFDALSKLALLARGDRLPCKVRVEGTDRALNCFAAQTRPHEVSFLIWGYNWSQTLAHTLNTPPPTAVISNISIEITGFQPSAVWPSTRVVLYSINNMATRRSPGLSWRDIPSGLRVGRIEFKEGEYIYARVVP